MNKKIAIFYKKSQYSIYIEEKKNAHIKSLLEDNSPVTGNLLSSHEENSKAIASVVEACRKLGHDFYMLPRSITTLQPDTDLVISVGGDGTFLDAQALIKKDVPLLGVNSDPVRSHGHYCAANKDSILKVLEQLHLPSDRKTFGMPDVIPVQRLQVSINGEVVCSRILNEILYCHPSPAAVSTYLLNDERQKSSGVWVSTASGSSGALFSAGGKKMHWSDSRLQYKVREPFMPETKFKNLSGYIEPDESLSFVSLMREGMVFTDGHRLMLPFLMGDVISINLSPDPLNWVRILS